MTDPRFDWIASVAWTLGLMGVAGMMSPPMDSMRTLYTYLKRRHTWMPAGWLFGVVWFVLYIFIAVCVVRWSDRDLAHQSGAWWISVWVLILVHLFCNL